jgi:hypothetical protein
MRTQLKFIWLSSLLLMCSFAQSQTLVQAMVYFDGNEAQAQYFPLANQQSIDEPFTVNVAGLSRGVHTMYVKVKDSNGRWSLYDHDNVQILGNLTTATLGSFEYFFDNDPGLGEGTQVAISGSNISEDFDIDLSGLSNGVHAVYIRVRDNNGQWSLYEKKMFQVVGSMMQPIVAMEYYYDLDPGFGNGNAIALDAFDGASELDLSVAGLTVGVHTLFVRVQDANGLWSHYDQANFTVTNPVPPNYLVHAEYYFDTDPGEGNGFPLDIPDSLYVNGNFDIAIPSNLSGNHMLCIRVRNANGDWSAPQCQNISICQIAIPTIAVNGQNCQNTPFVLSAPTGYSSYLWSNGATTQTIAVTQPGDYSVTVNQSGCSATSSITTDFVLAPSIAIASSGSQCPGEFQTLSASGGFDSYLWSNGATTSSIATDVAGTYSVQATLNGCTVSDTEQVFVFQVTPPNILTNGAACLGQLVNLSVPFAYSNAVWSNGESMQTIAVNESGTYTVSALNNGCPTQGSITLEFDVPPVFDIAITGGLCEGDLTTLNAGTAYDNYVWSTSETSSSIIVNSSGTYAVTVYNGDCSATQNATVEQISLPIPSITTNGNTLACTLSSYSYQWYLNGSVITGATSQFYNATQSGFYEVIIEEGECSATSALLNFTFIGIEEYTEQLIQLFPNPTSDVVRVNITEGAIDQIFIYSASGQLVKSIAPKTSSVALDLQELAGGIYNLRIITSGGLMETKHLLKF